MVDIAVLDNIHMEDTDSEEDLIDAFKVFNRGCSSFIRTAELHHKRPL